MTRASAVRGRFLPLARRVAEDPSARPSRSWIVARHLWSSSGLVVLWAGFAVAVTLVTLVVSRYVTIQESAWSTALAVPPWYMLGMGVYTTAVYLPLYIAHGITRREFAGQALVGGVGLTGVGAALIAVGFGLERVLYRIVGWPQELPEDHEGLFDAADQYGMIFLAGWLTFLGFFLVGAFVAAAFYRRAWGGLGGVLMIPVGLLVVAVTETSARRTGPPALEALDIKVATPVAVALSLAALAVSVLLAWAFVRDLPLRPKPA